MNFLFLFLILITVSRSISFAVQTIRGKNISGGIFVILLSVFTLFLAYLFMIKNFA